MVSFTTFIIQHTAIVGLSLVAMSMRIIYQLPVRLALPVQQLVCMPLDDR